MATWTLNFKSLAGVSCQLTITSSGSGGGTLTGADVPFLMDEDNSTSLLNVIRTRTGVIRLVETENGELDGLRPTTNTSHAVEFYYGNDLQFSGYIQPSNYESEWVEAPRILEFAVASPLSLADSTYFYEYDPPRQLTIKEVMEDICARMGVTYFTYPVESGVSINDKINSLVLCPYNSKYPESRRYPIIPPAEEEPIFTPMPVSYGIEGICRAYRWICHDEPDNIVFVPASGYATTFRKVNASSGTTTQLTRSDINLDSYTVVSDAGTESTIMPLSKVTIKYDGYIPTCRLPFDHCSFTGVIAPSGSFGNVPDNSFSCGFLHLETDEIEGYYYYSTRIINDNLEDYGAYLVSGGMGDELTEQLLIKMNNGWCGQGVFLTFKFYDHPVGDLILKMRWKWTDTNGGLSDLGNPTRPALFSPVIIHALIDCGGYHYTGNGVYPYWTTSYYPSYDYYVPVELKDNGDFECYIHDCPNDIPLTIGLAIPLNSQNLPPVANGEPFAIDNFSIEPAKTRFAKYTEPVDNSDVVQNTTPAVEEASVSFPLTFWRQNSNMIGSGNEVGKPNMSHMFSTRHCVRPDLQYQSSQFHLDRYQLDGMNYIIIGYSLDPINDKFTPTLLQI